MRRWLNCGTIRRGTSYGAFRGFALSTNHRRFLLLSAAASAVLAVLCIVAVDGRLAVALSSLSPGDKGPFNSFVRLCEVVFAFRISPYLYGVLIVAAGLLTKLSPAARRFSRPLLFVGLTHLTARFLVGILKPPFSRLRPFEALAAGDWHDQWFAPIGNSFPSGHAVHVWSLFFPLAVLFPQYRLAMFVLPVLVSIARVAVNDHYLGDVLTSCAVAALLTLWFGAVMLKRRTAGEPS